MGWIEFELDFLVDTEAANLFFEYKNLYAEITFNCPSYWLAEAFSDKSRAAYKYQFSVPVAYHSADVVGYFGLRPNTVGLEFEKAFMSTFFQSPLSHIDLSFPHFLESRLF